MLKNYFKIAWRNLVHNKVYSLLNILGLATGMAVALLIGLWVQYEVSYDGFHKNGQHIGVIMKKTNFNNQKNTQMGVMLPLYDELKMHYSDVKRISRGDWGNNRTLAIGDKKINSYGIAVDPDFLSMFSFPLVKGTMNNALKDPYSIVINESLAKSLFDDADPIGKMVRVDNWYDLKVTAVVKDAPTNSSVKFTFLTPFELKVATEDWVKNAKTQWQNNFLRNFVELKDGVSMEAFSNKIEHIVQDKVNDKKESALFIHPLTKWHLYSEFKNWVNTGGLIQYVRLFSIIGILVLIIACINFMNLSTARSEKRAREVGIRKAVGSQRRQLIAQFLGESLLTTLIALVAALIIAKLCLPLLSEIGFRDIKLDLTSIPLLLILIAGCFVTGLIAGSYPALYLSRFSAVKVLKGTFRAGKSANLPRKVLVVTQFSFSIALIIGTIIVFQQIQHAKSRPLGYNPNNLIQFGIGGDLKKSFDVMKQDLLNTGYVEAVTKSSSPMTSIWNAWDDYSWEGKDPNSRPIFSTIMVGYDYDKAAGLQLKQGRFYSKEFSTDSNMMVLNEASVQLMGFKKPIGQTVKLGDEYFKVIGVVANTVMQDPFRPVDPAVLLLRPDWIGQCLLRFKAGKDIRQAIAAIQPVVQKYSPETPFTFKFVDEVFEEKFQSENQVGQLSGIFAALAILISCLGLFGLASFMAERRVKEIGVRKVLGASVTQLWALLSKDFVLLVLISCIIASPLAFYFLKDWLLQYEYRINISPWVFAGAAGVAIVITLITVSFQAIKAALANPVKSLRSE